MERLKVTSEELFESLTGFDEIAISQQFGSTPTDLPGTLLARALIFIAQRREGVSDSEAYQSAMSLPTGELTAIFTPEGDEESGKESPAPEPQPENLLPSA